MRYETALAIVTAVATSTTTGCYSTWDVAPRSLVRLDSFRAGQTRQIERADGDGEVEFNADTELRILDIDGRGVAARLSSVDVRGPLLVGVERSSNAPITVNLARTASVQARRFSVGKTVGLSVGLGLGVPAATLGIAIAILASTGGFGSGRPLRVRDQAAAVRARLRLDPRGRTARRRESGSPADAVDDATRARIFAHWASEASAECASVPAFLALARDLRLASAPTRLVEDALSAAREEANHTELCAELASAQSPVPVTASTPLTPPNTDGDRRALLLRLATEALWDGCVAEGVAAAVARRSAPLARDEATNRALSIIARDEQGHADLARHVLAHCLSAGGRSIRDALVESFETRRDEEEALMDPGERGDAPGIDEDVARRHGIAGNAILRAARGEVRERTLALVGHTVRA